MKVFAILLLVALVGQISAQAYPRYVYRGVPVSEESTEVEEPQSDEADTEVDDEPQDDDVASDEDEQEQPPKFNRLFPSPHTGRPGSGGAGPTNPAFQTLMHEIDENGWKRPKKGQKPGQRSELVSKPVFRDDDEDSEEEEEEDDAEDDEAYSPDFDTMFPNPEGKQVGPTNMDDTHAPFGGQVDIPSSSGEVSPGAISGTGVPSFGRSSLYQGRSQRPMYYAVQSSARPNVRYVQKPMYDRASMTPVRAYAYGGNRRVVQAPMAYRRPTSTYPMGNRRVVQAQVVGYRPSSYNMGAHRPSNYNMMGGYRRPAYNMGMSGYNMAAYRRPSYNMGGHRQQVGPVYVSNSDRRPQYVSSPVRRTYVPATYAKQPTRQFTQSPYAVRMRRNNKFWNSQ